MSHNVLRTAPSICVAAVMQAVTEHGVAVVAIDDDGALRILQAGCDEARTYAANHAHLTLTTYTSTIKPSDVLADIAARLGELATYGQDRQRRK